MNQNVECAILAWLLLANGLILRKNTRLHVPLMLAGILDIALVVYLQVSKNAVQTVMAMEMSPLRTMHVLFSTLAFILYPAVLYLGCELLQGKKTLLMLHVRLAIASFAFRTIGLLCMLEIAFNN